MHTPCLLLMSKHTFEEIICVEGHDVRWPVLNSVDRVSSFSKLIL